MSYETDRIAALEDLVCQEAIKTKALETALAAAQAAIKRRDEVIAQIFVSVEGFNYGRCPPDSVKPMGHCKIDCKCCWRNWVDAKLKEGV
jgi:hypothetical protein